MRTKEKKYFTLVSKYDKQSVYMYELTSGATKRTNIC